MLLVALLLTTAALAPLDGESSAPSSPAAPRATTPRSTTPDAIPIPTGAALQTLLARTPFSPGLIDAKPGRKTRLAVEHFQTSIQAEPTGHLSPSDARALFDAANLDPDLAVADHLFWTIDHTITQADLDRITGPIPEDWNHRAELDFSGYTDAEDLFAERGWCSLELLRSLNTDVDFAALAPGDTLRLPNVSIDRCKLPEPARLEVDLATKLVRGFDSSDRCVLLLHCSIAAQIEHAPVGELHVKLVVTDPDYTFNPDSWPEVTNVDRKLRIAPGPRNPVGIAWIGLDRPGFGLHGTVRPQDIGKTGSHGCFRLTNWDAARLAKSTPTGTPVTVLEPPTEP